MQRTPPKRNVLLRTGLWPWLLRLALALLITQIVILVVAALGAGGSLQLTLIGLTAAVILVTWNRRIARQEREAALLRDAPGEQSDE